MKIKYYLPALALAGILAGCGGHAGNGHSQAWNAGYSYGHSHASQSAGTGSELALSFCGNRIPDRWLTESEGGDGTNQTRQDWLNGCIKGVE